MHTLGGTFAKGRILGIAPVDGPLVAAWREPRRGDEDPYLCSIGGVAVGGGRATFTVHFYDFTDTTRNHARLYVAPIASIGSTEEPVHEFPSGFLSTDRSVAHAWISEQLLALQVAPDGTLYSYRDGEWATLTGLGGVPGLPQRVELVGDQLLWEAWRGTDDVRLVQARWGEEPSVWRDVSPGVTKSFGTDGQDLGWLEGYDRNPDGSYARLELWTAPYARAVEAVLPRMVRRVEVRADAAVGGGWFAMRLAGDGGPQRVEVISLRDGSRRVFVPPGGFVTDAPYYATEREIMFPGAGVIRFDPSVLAVVAEP